MQIVFPILVTIWYNIVLWYRSISERLNSLSDHHFWSVPHHQVNWLVALIFVAVLFMLLFWDPLLVCICSCGRQILYVASFWKLFVFESIWSLCACHLWPALLVRYVVSILTQFGSERKKMINVNSSCKLGQCDSSSLSKTVDVDGILLSECY